MPHLAPLSWILAPSIFVLMLIIIMTSMWWHITPLFPKVSPSDSPVGMPLWPWCWSGRGSGHSL
uniref:ATP synthase F0 subunit 8 n=1 Tax=Namalycastis abiuma TaxID=862681 RepID=A0A342K7Y3_9ANNE|nr:ATP synthase F0 subunit 8 [Namalycastis abiuma]AMY15502.1 ATP synthase F0 subunit 8 [Namalycastis abiuma]